MFVNNANEGTWREAAAFGFACDLLYATERSRLSIATARAWLSVPIKLDQFIMLFAANGVPRAYITWAFVTTATAERLGEGAPPMPEDWNDGALLWIVDAVAPYGDLHHLLRTLRQHLHDRSGAIGYAGRRRPGAIFRDVKAVA